MDSIHFKVRNFIENKLLLPIPDDMSLLAPFERLDLLNLAIRRYHAHVPFHNILLMSQPPEKRRLPTLDELVDDVVSGRGGRCYTDNNCFKIALECLGFESYLAASTFFPPNSHVIIGVRNVLVDGDLYLVDGGCGLPFFSAIAMDFDSESPTQKDSHCKHKVVKRSGTKGDSYPTYERWIERTSGFGGQPISPDDSRGEDNDWFRLYHFTMEERDFEFFAPFISPLYLNPPALGPFHTMILISLFPDGKRATFKSVISIDEETNEKIRKFVLIMEQEEGKPVKETFLVDDEMQFERSLEIAGKLFVPLQNWLRDAFVNFKNLEIGDVGLNTT